MKVPTTAKKTPNMIPSTVIRIGSRIRMSMAPRPSTANTASAAADGFFSVSQRFSPASARSSRARRAGSPRAAATSASVRPAATPSSKWAS